MTMLIKSVTVGLGAALLLSGSAWFAAAQAPAPAAGDTSPLPVTFTGEQVSAGRGAFAASCAGCHGPGPAALPSSYRTTVGNFFGFIKENMPADAPGSLPPETYVAIIAAFLANSGYTAGTEPLPTDKALLDRMSTALP